MFHFRRILVPTDFSPVSQAALEAGANLADGRAGELFLVHAAGLSAVLPPLETSMVRPVATDDGAAVRERLECVPIPENFGRMAVHREVVEGTPDRIIPEYAEAHDIDVIVMGTHSRTGLSHFVLGSVTEAVVRHAKCPVLTIPATAISSPESKPSDLSG